MGKFAVAGRKGRKFVPNEKDMLILMIVLGVRGWWKKNSHRFKHR